LKKKKCFQELPGTADITADVDFKYISQQVLRSFLSDIVVVPRETREGWFLLVLTVETNDPLLSTVDWHGERVQSPYL
jgi:hypothetical protein